MARSSVWMSAVVGALALAGCAPTGRHCPGLAVEPGLPPDALPVCARSGTGLALGGPLLAEAEANVAGPRTVGLPYRLLSAHECQCLAVKASPMANVLDVEAQLALEQAAGRKFGAEKACEAAALNAQVLTYLALEDRNSSAAKALSTYSQLGEAEASRDLLELTLAQVSRALLRVREMKARGLEPPLDEHSLRRQQIDLETKAVRLRVRVEQLNSDLRKLLGFAPCPGPWRAWPADAFSVLAGPVDPEKAVAATLSHKPELLLLALLDARAKAGDFDALRQQLAGMGSMLGQAAAPACSRLEKLLDKLCGSSADDVEREARLRQLALLRADRERKAIEEVRQAAHTARAQAEVVLLTERVAENWCGRVRDAEDREAKGLGSFAETVQVRVEWLRARGDVVKEAALLQRALVRLRELQGTLPLDCTGPK